MDEVSKLTDECLQFLHFISIPLCAHYLHSRFLEASSQAAAHQQEELLGEEDPGDLLQGRLGLTPQVQDGGSQESDAKAEAEEHTPVGESLAPVALKQRQDPLVQQLHVGPGVLVV